MIARRIRHLLFAYFLLILLPGAVGAVVVRNADQFVEAINGSSEVIEIEGTIIFTEPFDSTGSGLPSVSDRLKIIKGREGALVKASVPGFRFLEIGQKGHVSVSNLGFSGFDAAGDGGVFLVRNGRLTLEGLVFEDNASQGHGGSIHLDGGNLSVERSRFEDNRANLTGGAISLRNTSQSGPLRFNQFIDNAAKAGCDLASRSVEHNEIRGNIFRGNCERARVLVVDTRNGPEFYWNTWLVNNGKAYFYRFGEVEDFLNGTWFYGNVMLRTDGRGKLALCSMPEASDLPRPAVASFGFNVVGDDSCRLTAGTDRLVGDNLEISDSPDPGTPTDDSPALDAVMAPGQEPNWRRYRCDISDVRGLGRPQDGNADGEFLCDAGALEQQEGENIHPSQTGAYFDPNRQGEGYFVEILTDGRAWVTFFTYTATGNQITESFPAWYFGLGRVVGNSIVVSDFSFSFGGRFGSEFEPSEVEQVDSGGLSLVFKDCESTENAGSAFFRNDLAECDDCAEHHDQLTNLVRLSQVVSCNGTPVSNRAGLSGTYFDPDRNGEGIIVHWIDDDEALVIWFTFDDKGNQLWMISDDVQVAGNTVTAKMLYPEKTTAFGPNFDPEEIGLEPWGTLTLEYTDCDTIEFGFDSEIEGFGSGSFTYQRLTQLAGTTCDL